MRAIRVHAFGPPEVMKIEDIPEPPVGAGEVLVRVRAVGVNPVDTYIRAGLYPGSPDLPYTPGFDAAGEVEKVGSGVTRFRPGDRVYTAWTVSGAYAEKALCTESQLHPLPEAASFGQGAAINVPYGAAWQALFGRARAIPGETVLVHGATGGVGIAALQLAKAAGLHVIGTAGSDRGRELALAEGAQHVLDHHNPTHLEEAVTLTGGRGLDVIIELLANVNLGNDLPALAPRGRVVVVGSRGKVEIDPRNLMGKDAAILGMSLFNASEQDRRAMHAAFAAGLEAGTIRPVVSRELPLAEAAAAHHAVLEASTFGKIVLVP